ncbi:MAG: Late embryosis abundant protein 2 [Gemmatimonadetes bacterium]|nr:Late embryosis abundant protein 2 [Gemmatimonadota bacterium]
MTIHRTRAGLRAVLSLAAVALAAACGSGVFKQPTVALDSISVGGLGLTGGTLLVNVRIQNPNGFTLGADRVTYDLAVHTAPGDSAWSSIARGTYERPFRVGGGRTEVVQIPVEFSYAGAGGAGAALMRNGAFTYRARGSVLAHTPIGDREVPFYQDGTVTSMGGVVNR